VVSGPGGDPRRHGARRRVDDHDPALLRPLRVVPHPQVASVRLEGDPNRPAAHVHVADRLQRVGVHDRHLRGQRHRHEEPLLIPALDPVGARFFQGDVGEEVGPSRHPDEGVDDRDRAVPVQRQDEIAVQVDQRADADAALEEEADLLAAGHDLALLP
jgi:hypothetical protein